jgi:hypothetical protein
MVGMRQRRRDRVQQRPILWWMTASLLTMSAASLSGPFRAVSRLCRPSCPCQLVAVGAKPRTIEVDYASIIGFIAAVAMFSFL